MRFFALFTFLLFLLPLWAATGVTYKVEPPPFVNMDEHSKAELNAMLRDVSDSYGGIPLREIISQRGFLVIGTDLSIAEREAMLAYAKQNPIFSNFKKARDTESMELLRTDSFLVILGGPSQNDLAFYLEKEEMVKRTWNISDSMMARSGTTPGGGKFIILSDLRGYKNLRKEGIISSPLAGIMPREYIPIASFLISIFGLAAIPVIRIYLAGIFKTKERDTGRKKVDEKFTGINLFGVPIRFREILSVFLGAFFYGMGVAYLYAGFTLELIPMGIASVIFVALLYYLRSLTRWFFDGRYKTHTEYVFWGTGGSLCWISSIFGFTLQTPGFEVEKIPEKFEKKAAFMKWAVLSVAMFVGLSIFIINFFFPNESLPVFQTVASAIAVTEILPFVPMPGVLIKKWNFWLWAVTFFTFVPIYFLINFYV